MRYRVIKEWQFPISAANDTMVYSIKNYIKVPNVVTHYASSGSLIGDIRTNSLIFLAYSDTISGDGPPALSTYFMRVRYTDP